MTERIKRLYKILSLEKENLEQDLQAEFNNIESVQSNKVILDILDRISKINLSVNTLNSYIDVNRNNGDEPTR